MLQIASCILKTQKKSFCVGGVGLMLPLNPVRPYYEVNSEKGKEGVCGLSQIGDCHGYLALRPQNHLRTNTSTRRARRLIACRGMVLMDKQWRNMRLPDTSSAFKISVTVLDADQPSLHTAV